MEKICKLCRCKKPEADFGWKNRSKLKLESRCRVCRNLTAKARNTEIRREALIHYSNGGTPACVCCGENKIEFLTLDHTLGNGRTHRKEDPTACMLAHWLRRRGFPAGFRTLCMNCNMSYGHYGYCPHTPLLAD